MIPYGRQSISEGDIDAVVEVLRSDWLTQGPVVPSFEKAVASYCGARYGVGVNSGTSALHLACKALDIGPGDYLWTVPNTFVASANCALYCGASVDFVDIDPLTYNLCPEALEQKLVYAEQQGVLPKAIVAVDFSGQSCLFDAISELSSKYGFQIIEDASHAIGGEYKGKKIGSGSHAAIKIFSFHPVKLMTTGEGGMLLTDSEEHYRRAVALRSHGITRDKLDMKHVAEGDWYYEQQSLGFNYRLTDIQAALGLSQLSRLDGYVQQRRTLANFYDIGLAELPLILPWQHPDTNSSWHLYVIRLKLGEISKTRREVFDSMRSAGVGVNVHYIPVHTQPYYREMGFSFGDFPESERYYSEALTLPLYPSMTIEQQDYVVSQLKEVL